MADEEGVRERFEGREPYRGVKPEPRTFYLGDVEPPPGHAAPRPDPDIKRDVETALFYDEAVSSLGVKVSVDKGIVTLEGTVNSPLARQLAEEDAWLVAGVQGVNNCLVVHETPTPSRAAGQDVVPAKPPEPGYGLPLGEGAATPPAATCPPGGTAMAGQTGSAATQPKPSEGQPTGETSRTKAR